MRYTSKLVGLVLFAFCLAAGPATKPATQPAKPSNKVVFVLDASGTMINRMGTAKAALELAIAGLEPTQSFTVIAATDNHVIAFSPTLVPATERARQEAIAHLMDLTPAGVDSLGIGMSAAAKLKPDVVWLITDGDFTSPPKIEAAVKAARVAGNMRVNTTTAGGGEEPTAAQLAIIYRLAIDNGGICVDADGNKLTSVPSAKAKPAEDARPLPPLPKGKSALKE